MDDVRWLDEREMRAWRGFLEMRRVLDSVVNQQLLRDAGLSGADYALLVPLSEAPGLRLRAIELRRCVDWEKSRLSHQIRRMEQRGLIRRVECPSDARSTYITLTEAGMRAIEAAAPDHVATVRRHFIDLLTEDELKLFASITGRVLKSLTDCPDAPAPCPDAAASPCPGSAVPAELPAELLTEVLAEPDETGCPDSEPGRPDGGGAAVVADGEALPQAGAQ